MNIDHVVPALAPTAAARLRAALDEIDAHDTHTIVVDGVELDVKVRDAVLPLLAVLATGKSVAVGSVQDLLTTSQAAEVLGVSDTYVRRLADAGDLTIEMRGTHRRFLLSDVAAYRRKLKR